MTMLNSSTWHYLVCGLCAFSLAPWVVAATPDTDQRLQLLERRAGKITELTLQIHTLQRTNNQLRGQIELLHHQLAQMERRQLDRYQDLTQRLDALNRPATTPHPPVTLPSLPDESPQPTLSTAVESAPESAEQAYAAAWALLSPQQRQYAQAVSAFRAFLADYPQHSLAVNAYYWLGEAHFVLQDNAAALTAFTQVVEKYPDSTKVPDAWYMIARIYQARNDLTTARQIWQQIVQDHPDTQAATSAQNKLTGQTQPQTDADAES